MSRPRPLDQEGRRSPPDVVEASGVESGFNESEVSRICADLGTEVDAFRTRPLDSRATPYVFLAATYCKARIRGQVVSQVVVPGMSSPPVSPRAVTVECCTAT
jgi:hypothetical protein